MAIIATTDKKSEVLGAVGKTLDATVNLSAALMEMLSTTYSFILMSAIREAIQNACDAARKAGLSFADGVQVCLPTLANPMITVIDKGSGMTQTFMEANDGYLSFGSSTKDQSDDSAGGLGVGRWAAYGYCRECYITTCHASDMVDRTYYQFLGEDLKPHVQLGQELPGTRTGTKVFFPVKETDIEEALRAVSWVKSIMQMTMGDSFSVDYPDSLPAMLPASSGTVLNLGEVDESLNGVIVYPMQAQVLKYGRQGLQSGSLVVLTNRSAGVGGLPFHVQSPGEASVFHFGMVIEIPMSFRLQFMASREELKNTDEAIDLFKRIDAAALVAFKAKVAEFFHSPHLSDKALLSNLIGEGSAAWNSFALANSGNAKVEAVRHALDEALGAKRWNGRLEIPYIVHGNFADTTIRYLDGRPLPKRTLRVATPTSGVLGLPDTKGLFHAVHFTPTKPIVIIAVDQPSGGMVRFREWLRKEADRSCVVYSSVNPADAVAGAMELNARFGNALDIIKTSSMPAPSKVVTASGRVASMSKKESLTFYDTTSRKQSTEVMDFCSLLKSESLRVWVEKDGAVIRGFKSDVQVASLFPFVELGSVATVMKNLKVTRLYLLTPKQVKSLQQSLDDAIAEGLFDRNPEDFGTDADDLAALDRRHALEAWIPFESAIQRELGSSAIQEVLAGKVVHRVESDYLMTELVSMLGGKPRLCLTGTKFDAAISPHLDLVTGESKMYTKVDAELSGRVKGLVLLSAAFKANEDDPADRKEMLNNLNALNTVGVVDYRKVNQELRQSFPILEFCNSGRAMTKTAVDHLAQGLATVYG